MSKFRVKTITKFRKEAVFEFDNRDTAFEFAAALFDEVNVQLEDPVRYVVIGPAA